MPEDIKLALQRLNNSKVMQEFKQIAKESFLFSFLLVGDKNKVNESNWTINFYNPLNKKVYAFELNGKINLCPEQDLINQSDVTELKINNVNLNFNEALTKANKLFNEQNLASLSSLIVLLQNVNNKPVWTLSFLLTHFKHFVVKIDATNGSVIESKII